MKNPAPAFSEQHRIVLGAHVLSRSIATLLVLDLSGFVASPGDSL